MHNSAKYMEHEPPSPFDDEDAFVAAPAPDGFQVRDVLRFFAVDIILIIMIKLLLGAGGFGSFDSYILASLAAKAFLAAYLGWLVFSCRRGWADTGAARLGGVKGWIASVLLYAAGYPLLLYINVANDAILHRLYAVFGSVYEPQVQNVTLYLFSNLLEGRTRLVLLAFAIVLGPIMEEMAFRGVGMDAYRRRSGIVSAMVWTSLLFGLYHFSLQTLVPLSAIGFILAVARVWSGSLWCPVFIHCLHNGITLAVMAGWLKGGWLW